jgi:hypothetical protein
MIHRGGHFSTKDGITYILYIYMVNNVLITYHKIQVTMMAIKESLTKNED